MVKNTAALEGVYCDIYTQGLLVEEDFNIEEEAGGVGKEIVKTYNANVTDTLEIQLYWAGKGTTSIPLRGVYGPIVSAISENPDFPVPQEDGEYGAYLEGPWLESWLE